MFLFLSYKSQYETARVFCFVFSTRTLLVFFVFSYLIYRYEAPEKQLYKHENARFFFYVILFLIYRYEALEKRLYKHEKARSAAKRRPPRGQGADLF